MKKKTNKQIFRIFLPVNPHGHWQWRVLFSIKQLPPLKQLSLIQWGILQSDPRIENQDISHVTEGGSDPVGSKKFRSDPTEFLSESDWRESDEIRSKTTGSAGRIDSPGYVY